MRPPCFELACQSGAALESSAGVAATAFKNNNTAVVVAVCRPARPGRAGRGRATPGVKRLRTHLAVTPYAANRLLAHADASWDLVKINFANAYSASPLAGNMAGQRVKRSTFILLAMLLSMA